MPAKLEELNKTYGTPNLISEVALEELLGVVGWVKSREHHGKSWKIIGKYMGKSCEHVGKPCWMGPPSDSVQLRYGRG